MAQLQAHQSAFASAYLQQSGLIETTIIQNITFIDTAELLNMEKIIRLHYDLDINIEGIEAITSLLNRMEAMKNEIIYLKNKLSFYGDFLLVKCFFQFELNRLLFHDADQLF